MSKFVSVISGAAELALGIAAMATGVGASVAPFLIAAGAGSIIGGIGTILSQGAIKGFSTTIRDPTAPWDILYGRGRTGGNLIYANLWPSPGPSDGVLSILSFGILNQPGGGNQMLDLVIELAAHGMQSIDAVLFDQQRVQIDTNAAPPGAPAGSGTSFSPINQTNLSINSISRNNGVVIVVMSANIPYLIAGDRIQIAEDGVGSLTANNLIGTFQVAQILQQVVGSPGSITFSYLSGGTSVSISGHGHINTLWADYGRTLYFEPMLDAATRTLGQTFVGMTYGTPLHGDFNNVIKPEHTGTIQGADAPNPWTANCSDQGKSLVFLRLQFNPAYYSGSIPQISFLYHGKNDIADYRTSPPTIGYSENSALCNADFLANPTWGFGCEYGSDIPLDNLIAAANACDEAVYLLGPYSPPQTEPAYTCNGKFNLSMSRGEILRNMLTSCAGRLTTYGGEYIIWPAAWTGNSFAIGSNPGGGVIPLGNYEAIAAGPIRWRPTISIRDLFNGVKGTYISQSDKWMPADFPPYAQDSIHGYGPGSPPWPEGDVNLAADGGVRRWKDIQLPFTISAATAQRIAKIELLRSRQFGTGTFVFNMTAYQVVPMDLMIVTWALMGWTAKQLEVTGLRFRIEDSKGEGEGPALLLELDVQDVSPAIYDWNDGVSEELSPQGYHIAGVPQVFFATEQLPVLPPQWLPYQAGATAGDALFPAEDSFDVALTYSNLTGGQATMADGTALARIQIIGAEPVNATIAGCPAPVITGATVSATGGTIPDGATVWFCVTADDGNGNYSPPSNVYSLQIPVNSPPTNTNSITMQVGWPSFAGLAQFAIFASLDGADNLGAQLWNAVTWDVLTMSWDALADTWDSLGGYSVALTPAVQPAYTPTSLTLTSAEPGSWAPPDDNLALVRVKACVGYHLGVLGASIDSISGNQLVCAACIDPANIDNWTGRALAIIGRNNSGLPLSSVPFWSSAVSAFDPATGTFTLARSDTAALMVGDAFVVCTLGYDNSGNPTAITDAGLKNALNYDFTTGVASPHSGLTVNLEVGMMIRVISGKSRGSKANILANTADTYTIDQPIVIDATSIWVVVEAGWPFDVDSNVNQNTNPFQPMRMVMNVPNFSGQSLLLLGSLVDLSGAESADNGEGPLRLLYVYGKGNAAQTVFGIYFELTADSSNNVNVDIANGLQQELILTATQVTFTNPIWTGGTLVDGVTALTLYLTMPPPPGGAPSPIFTTGPGGFASDIANDGLDPTGSTRSTFQLVWLGGVWVVTSFSTGRATS